MSFTKTQAPTLQAREQNSDEIVAQLFVQNTRLYTSFSTKDEFAKFILSDEEGSDTCNELLYGPCATYLDLDCPLQLSELGYASVPEFVEKFDAFLILAYKKHLGVDLSRNQILWCTSCRPEKTSFHIVIKHPDFCWPAKMIKPHLRRFMKILASETLEVPGFHYLSETPITGNEIRMLSIIDSAIYHLNRCFRTLHSRKPGQQVRFQPMKNGVIVPVTHSLLVNYFVTETENKTPYTLKTEAQPPPKKICMKRALLQRLAEEYGSTVAKVCGSLVQLRNTKARCCPISGEENESDNGFFIRKHGCLYLGCHNADCQGKLKKVHEFSSTFQTYDDYQKLLKMPQAERTLNLIHEYLRSTTVFIDIPGKHFFTTTRRVPCKVFPKLKTREILGAPKLFSGNSDVKFRDAGGDNIALSEELTRLVTRRNMTIKTGTEWVPHLQDSKYQPSTNSERYNTFPGFCLDQDIPTDVEFPKTAIYELLQRLTDFQEESTTYLLDFLSAKLQKPFFKAPISLCWVKTQQGCGKGTLKRFLEVLFASGNDDCMISYNKMSQFTSQFNGELQKALWMCLEEVTCQNKNSLREFSGLLKDVTSQTSCVLEKKGHDRTVCDVYANLIIFSNELRVLNVSRDCRRICCFEVNNDKTNDKAFFDSVYKEISDVQVMKSAFDFFSTRDISKFDYRCYPRTKLLERLKNCSDDLDHKFVQYLFKEFFTGQYEYSFNAQGLYEAWQMFIESRGLRCQRDLGWMQSCFDDTCELRFVDDYYIVNRHEIEKILEKY